MKSALISLLAILLLAGGVYVAIDLRSTEESAQTPAVKRDRIASRRPSPVPSLVKKLSKPSLHMEDRIRAVRELPSDLSEEESNALIDLLRQPAPTGMSTHAWYTMLNEIMEVMRQPRFKWSGYGSAMSGLVIDRHADPVVRDYAAQHLALYLSEESENRDISAGMKAFLKVLRGEREAHEGVTGTILMSLCDLRSKREKTDFKPYDDELGKIVTGYADGSTQASLPNRIAAIQAAGRMGVSAALPAIRRLAEHGAPNPSIRLSCVAALGYYGDASDLTFLKKLASSDDQLRFAAQTALRNHARHK